MSMADVDTPSGFSSVLDPSHMFVSNATSEVTAAERDAFGSDLLSSTMRDDAGSSMELIDVSAIQTQELLYCPKCGHIFQT